MKNNPHALTDLKILVAVPTYKRAGDVGTLALFEDAVLFVDTFELDEYRKAYPDATIVEFKGKGLVGKRNCALDYARKHKYDFIVEVDDDFEAMAGFAQGYTDRITDKKLIYQMIERLCVMTRDAGTVLFTTGQTADIRKYKRSEPFSLFATLKIGFHGLDVKNCTLKYDERFFMKHDIDMCLQVLLAYRFYIIENRYSFYYRPTMGSKGGLASLRSKDREDKMMALLRTKWGEETFSNGTSDRVSIYTLNIANPFK